MTTKPSTPRRPKSPGGKPPTRKERERLVRRAEIVHAAQAVFAEKGFDKATLEEIADRAEFGKGTVYNYFDSKESLFAAAITSLFDDVRQIAREASRAGQGVRASLDMYTRRMIEYYKANHDFCSMLMHEWDCPESPHGRYGMQTIAARIQSVAEPIGKRLKTAMARREIRRADPMSLAMMFIGLVHHFYIHVASQAHAKTAGNVATQAELIVSVFFDGIALRGSRSRV